MLDSFLVEKVSYREILLLALDAAFFFLNFNFAKTSCQSRVRVLGMELRFKFGLGQNK